MQKRRSTKISKRAKNKRVKRDNKDRFQFKFDFKFNLRYIKEINKIYKNNQIGLRLNKEYLDYYCALFNVSNLDNLNKYLKNNDVILKFNYYDSLLDISFNLRLINIEESKYISFIHSDSSFLYEYIRKDVSLDLESNKIKIIPYIINKEEDKNDLYLNNNLKKYEYIFDNKIYDYNYTFVFNGSYYRLSIDDVKKINEIIVECIEMSRVDWDSFETSWDFKEHPLIKWSKALWDATAIGATMHYYYGGQPKVNSPLELCYMLWQGECKDRFDKLKANEEKLNKIFIDLYGLQDELTPDVEDKDVTVRLADKERDIRSFISYLVGVAMGRYSLDVPGLAFAGGDWDTSKYISFKPDDDGIIPIYSGIGMEDGLTTILISLIKQIYGEDTYRQNIDFIAEALGKNNNESSEETLNRYLNDGFYADHLKIYQKRPIYWLFTSGKKAGFKCLIYMHRYNEDTLARINAKYFLPESTRKKNELEEINARITRAEGREKIRLEKQRQQLAASYNEAIEYGQVLDHMANKYIDIDLDDGVKVNYAKFQGIEIVTDGGSKVKKDLLAPLK